MNGWHNGMGGQPEPAQGSGLPQTFEALTSSCLHAFALRSGVYYSGKRTRWGLTVHCDDSGPQETLQRFVGRGRRVDVLQPQGLIMDVEAIPLAGAWEGGGGKIGRRESSELGQENPK